MLSDVFNIRGTAKPRFSSSKSFVVDSPEGSRNFLSQENFRAALLNFSAVL